MKDNFIKIGPLVVSIIGLLLSIYNNLQNRRLRKEIQEKDNRLEANLMYEKIRNKRETFEDVLVEIISLEDNLSIAERQRILLKTYNKYVSLYNEVEDFCTKIFDGVISSEDYIEKTVQSIFNELAELQVEAFRSLTDYANTNNLTSIKKPDYKAFDKYDKFLIKYNGGETSHFWKKLKGSRRENGFE